MATEDSAPCSITREEVTYRQYKDEHDLPTVMRLIDNELSEPYSIFTYRYFLHNWPHLCFLAYAPGGHCFGCVVAKQDVHRGRAMRGYIAMLTVEAAYRYLGVGSELVQRAIGAMAAGGCEEVALEAEVCNAGALRLYAKLGFLRDKRLHRYYLSGSDAYRLKLLLPAGAARRRQEAEAARQLEALALGDGQQHSAEQPQQQQQQGEPEQPPAPASQQPAQQQQQQSAQQQQQQQRQAKPGVEAALQALQQHGQHDHQAG